jgi:hypothetical protein
MSAGCDRPVGALVQAAPDTQARERPWTPPSRRTAWSGASATPPPSAGSTWRPGPGRCWPCSAPTAPARPRPCGSWPPRSSRTRAGPGWPATRSSPRPSRSAGGVTVLLTTQYMEEADQLADDVLVIDRGRVAAVGTPDQLKTQVGRQVLRVSPVRVADVPVVARVVTDLSGAAPEVAAHPGLAQPGPDPPQPDGADRPEPAAADVRGAVRRRLRRRHRRVGVGLGVVGHPGAGRITVHPPAAGDGLPEVLVVGEPLQPSPEAVVHLVHLGQQQPGTRHRHHPAPDEGTHEVTAGRSR